jgi:hypothetical protein
MSELILPFRRWVRWDEVERCFFPGRGRRAELINPELAALRWSSVVYWIALSIAPPKLLLPTAEEVRYIGETGQFRRRMGEFGCSAGFWGKRRNGHYAGWWWPFGRTEDTWFCFSVIGGGLAKDLARMHRRQVEAGWLARFVQLHGHEPEFNGRKQ